MKSSASLPGTRAQPKTPPEKQELLVLRKNTKRIVYTPEYIYIYVRTCRAVRQAQAHPVLFSYSLKQLRTKLRLFVNEPVSYIGFSVVPAFAVAVLVETPNIVNKVAWEQGPLVGPASLPAASCISAPLSGSWVPNGMTSDRLGPGR